MLSSLSPSLLCTALSTSDDLNVSHPLPLLTLPLLRKESQQNGGRETLWGVPHGIIALIVNESAFCSIISSRSLQPNRRDGVKEVMHQIVYCKKSVEACFNFLHPLFFSFVILYITRGQLLC